MIAHRVKPPPRSDRANLCASPRRCYGIEFTAPQCSHGASALLPHFFTMTGKPATSLCCTCPGVTPGGRYPLSLPFGARTFLTRVPLGTRPRLSNLVADLFYRKIEPMSNVLQNLCFLYILWMLIYSSLSGRCPKCKMQNAKCKMTEGIAKGDYLNIFAKQIQQLCIMHYELCIKKTDRQTEI